MHSSSGYRINPSGFGIVIVTVGLALLVTACAAQPTPTLPALPQATVLPPPTTLTTAPASTAPPTDMPSPAPPALPTAAPPPSATSAPTPAAPYTCAETQGRVAASEFASAVLARTVHYQIYYPPCYAADPARKFPALYLLHGAHADDTQWLDLNIAPAADQLITTGVITPAVIVLPDGDYRGGEDYGAFVRQDLIPHIEQTAQVSAARTDRAIGGLSLGGYWAYRLALTHPELFAAVGGHSAAVDSGTLAAFPPNPAWQNLRMYLDVGTADPLAPGVQRFVTALRTAGLAPAFHLNPGAHTRPYWRSHTADYLRFYFAK